MHLYVVPQEIDSIHILTRNCRFYCCFGQILCWTSSISLQNSCSPRVGQFLRRGAFSTAAADESTLTKGKQKCNFLHLTFNPFETGGLRVTQSNKMMGVQVIGLDWVAESASSATTLHDFTATPFLKLGTILMQFLSKLLGPTPPRKHTNKED